MSKLNVYCLGGAGINVGSGWITNSNSGMLDKASFIGADFSQNNLPKNNEFAVIHPDDTRGGGSIRGLNSKLAPMLVSQVVTELKPADFNIIIAGSSGGSGSLLLPFMVKDFLSKGIPFVIFMIFDKSSVVFLKNTVNCLRSLEAQKKEYNTPVVFDLVENKPDMTHGQVNKLAYDRLDLLSIFLTDEHDHSDFQDIKHLIQYNKVLTDVEPSLTAISYFTDQTLDSFSGKPITRFSLFESLDDVRTINLGAHYVTGIRNPDIPKPQNAKEIHMILEYDILYSSLNDELVNLEDQSVKTKSEYSRKANENLTEGSDEDGMFY